MRTGARQPRDLDSQRVGRRASRSRRRESGERREGRRRSQRSELVSSSIASPPKRSLHRASISSKSVRPDRLGCPTGRGGPNDPGALQPARAPVAVALHFAARASAPPRIERDVAPPLHPSEGGEHARLRSSHGGPELAHGDPVADEPKEVRPHRNRHDPRPTARAREPLLELVVELDHVGHQDLREPGREGGAASRARESALSPPARQVVGAASGVLIEATTIVARSFRSVSGIAALGAFVSIAVIARPDGFLDFHLDPGGEAEHLRLGEHCGDLRRRLRIAPARICGSGALAPLRRHSRRLSLCSSLDDDGRVYTSALGRSRIAATSARTLSENVPQTA